MARDTDTYIAEKEAAIERQELEIERFKRAGYRVKFFGSVIVFFKGRERR